jgi:hypothetical protein
VAAAGGGRERVTESERRGRRRKEKCRLVYFYSLPSARDLALGKVFFNFKIFFAECQIAGTWQRLLCRVSTDIHSAKMCSRFFAECQPVDTRQRKSLPSVFLWQPNFLWYVPTLCRPKCTILGQL